MFTVINGQIKQDSCYFFYKGGDFLNIPKPKKKANGTWIIQVMVDGKRQGKVFDTEKEAIAWAASIKAGITRQKKNPSNMTLQEAFEKYIESKDAVLSPSTIAGYKRMAKNIFPSLMPINLSNLTQERVQKAVNDMARVKSPKYVKNAHGLLSAVLREYMPDFVLRTTLPQKQKYEISIPTEQEIQAIYEEAKGTDFELPYLLAIWLGLRASEISGLTWDCIDGDYIHIKQARVRGESEWMLKGTKSYSGNRKLLIPGRIKELIEHQPRTDDYIIHLSGQAIYERFSRLCKRIGVQHYRFHDLRHVNASVMLSLNVPDKYAMERMGHSGNAMLKSVYQHTMSEKQKQVADDLDNYFEKQLNLKIATKIATK